MVNIINKKKYKRQHIEYTRINKQLDQLMTDLNKLRSRPRSQINLDQTIIKKKKVNNIRKILYLSPVDWDNVYKK